MRVFCGLGTVRLSSRPTAVAVGNFDGLHLGHRRIMGRLRRLSVARNLRPVVLTFHPHPERALGKRSVAMIDTLDQRLARLAEAGAEAVVVAAFDRAFAGLDAADFVLEVLAGKLKAQAVVVGRDFRFGKNRRGDVAGLRTLGRPLGLRVQAVPPACVGGLVVSSSAIRRLLAGGRVEEAARLLGRPYEITGKVVAGRCRGVSLGFPTANVLTGNEILPDGVFVSQTVWRDRVLPSVTSIGTNPTFGTNPVSVESHVLDGSCRMYGAGITVRLLHKIRATRKFRDAAALAAGIARDVAAARAHFGSEG